MPWTKFIPSAPTIFGFPFPLPELPKSEPPKPEEPPAKEPELPDQIAEEAQRRHVDAEHFRDLALSSVDKNLRAILLKIACDFENDRQELLRLQEILRR